MEGKETPKKLLKANNEITKKIFSFLKEESKTMRKTARRK